VDGAIGGADRRADAKPADCRSRVLSVFGGVALALLIGAGLFIAAVLTI
jgi:hypothetical protein